MSARPEVLPHTANPYSPSHDLFLWLQSEFRKHGDLFRTSIYGVDAYVVSKPEYVEHILRVNWKAYRKGQIIKRIGLLLGDGLMVSEGELWKNQRQMVQHALHGATILNIAKITTEENLDLQKRWERAAAENTPVNVTRDVDTMVLRTVLRSIFGADFEQVNRSFKILADEPARDMQFAQRFRLLRPIVNEIAGLRKKSGSAAHDILGLLMEAESPRTSEKMSREQLANEVLTLVVAGYETTASTLQWMWYELACHPAVHEALQRELDALMGRDLPSVEGFSQFELTRAILDETLRLYPAGWLITRKALADDVVGDYLLPRGTEVYISPYIIQRHPSYWREPDRFLPERFTGPDAAANRSIAFLPFSLGPRKCIGEALARMEMQIHLMMLAKTLRFLEPGNGEPAMVAGVNLRMRDDLILLPKIRQA
jgi:cytochrome P450